MNVARNARGGVDSTIERAMAHPRSPSAHASISAGPIGHGSGCSNSSFV